MVTVSGTHFQTVLESCHSFFQCLWEEGVEGLQLEAPVMAAGLSLLSNSYVPGIVVVLFWTWSPSQQPILQVRKS